MPLQNRQAGLRRFSQPQAQRLNFLNAFLDVVLAKRTLTGAYRLDHRVCAKSFGDGQQSHTVRRTTGRCRGLGDLLAHEGELAGNAQH